MQFSYENSLWVETWQLKVQHMTAAICCYCFTKYSQFIRRFVVKVLSRKQFWKAQKIKSIVS